ncbi:hypothetical protein GUITHDRAFT_157030 [Guillardia theta CCMP2712]|uniref:Methyltransferase domain-containing protein n=1 Tax=Guillardia theta (strain CCMP2712) TaxID=905079 RepID=L1JX83_GUITC|nr:hypothetical protein GUITHDRAFT_157030 [Guillardia theta CCMP2712]EKX52795.1 hypothetical protein GUITHDRAFT_157030 [Guillardia theta CCMP2712]|eukprot:XP_005839775.1 hypothetical protein GUITHDRAFT_157030 [Guillardia theta CCMP2712]
MMPDFLTRWGMRRLLETNLVHRIPPPLSLPPSLPPSPPFLPLCVLAIIVGSKAAVDCDVFKVPKDVEVQRSSFMEYVESLKKLPIAMNTADANDQHYELPPEFFFPIMGDRLKYSCCIFKPSTHLDDINTAEVRTGVSSYLLTSCLQIDSLRQVEERAELVDGLDILELGCGWGSLSLYMAERFPKSRITSVSNSNGQRQHIEARAKERGLKNLTVITCDMNNFEAPEGKRFDRICSIEMFEHMKNYDTLMGKCVKWLKPGGKMFIHIFVHKHLAYNFETEGDDNWMGKYFFTGEVWLRRMDRNMKTIRPILSKVYGEENVTLWTARWRGFFLACSELFNYNRGNEWYVSHYLFEKPSNM